MTRVSDALKEFFMGKFYPIILAVIVTAGHVMEREMLTATIIVLLALLQLCICDSIRPLIIIVATFIFQVTLEHSPATPTFSDYYFSEWRLTHIIVLGAIVVLAFGFFVIRKKLWRGFSSRNIGLLLSLLLLAIAFSSNGFGSDTWSAAGLAFGFAQGVFYIILFTLFYFGLSEENDETELLDYINYISLIISLMMLVQMALLFTSGEAILDGSIVKSKVLLGWATCNPLGTMLVTMIPVLFYGTMTKKTGIIYFLTATAMYAAAVSTCSRNALLFGTLIYGGCLLIVAFGAPKKWQRTVGKLVICLGVLAVIAVAVLLKDKLAVLFKSFVNQGADDNGRFYLWALAWDQFMDNKLFGGGFFAFGNEMTGLTINIMPTMAHNTLLELLSSTGIVGTFAYLFYRVRTVMPLLDRPTLGKTMLGLTYLTVVFASLLDVFVFCFYPMLFPLIVMAVVCRIYDIQKSRN